MADPENLAVGLTWCYVVVGAVGLRVLFELERTAREVSVMLGGLRVRYVFLHRFHVTRSKVAGSSRHSACSLPAVEGARRRLPE